MKIIHGDCLEEFKRLEDNSVDAVITDPPYGLSNTKPVQVAEILGRWVNGDVSHVPEKRGGFMGKDWDSFVPPPAVWEECMRVLKPGGHMAVFAGARTQDLMGLSIRLAGFEIRDTLGWIYGSGFPKSHDIGKAIDKAAGAEREVVSERPAYGIGGNGILNGHSEGATAKVTAPATSEAQRWDGWGTALKPAIEPIILARKPLVGTVAQNVLEHGVGGLNIDACRVHSKDAPEGRTRHGGGNAVSPSMMGPLNPDVRPASPAGRFPANVLLDEHAATEMDQQSGVRDDRGGVGNKAKDEQDFPSSYSLKGVPKIAYNGSGGASRYFPVFKYQAKAPKKERPVIYKNNCECEEWQSQQKDTTGSTATAETSWSMSTSGNSTTEKCQRDTTSTTSTMTSLTTGSKTSPASAKLSISESIPDVRSETENGGSHASSVEVSNQSLKITGTSVKKAGHSTDDAGHATSEKWYTTSECEKCGEPRRKVQHVTVKPLKLMEWLVTLITPEGGTILDPFAGTGTTLQAATNKGFHPIGIEADADYIQLIHQRMEGGEQSTRNN